MKHLIQRTTSMLLMVMAILLGYNSQASAANGLNAKEDNYLDIANGHGTIGNVVNRNNRPKLDNYYSWTEDLQNNVAWLTMSAYGAYHARENANNKWITTSSPTYSSIDAWGASDPFSGGGVFFGDNEAQAFGDNNNNYNRDIFFYVTSCTEIRLIGKNTGNSNASSSIVVHEGTFNGNTFRQGDQVANPSNSTLSASVNFAVSGLDYNKIYRVRVRSHRSHIYEIAFKTVIDPKGTAYDSYLDIANGHPFIGTPSSDLQKYYQYTEYPADKAAWLTMSVYGAYHASRYASNSWISYSEPGNTEINNSWDNSSPFIGPSSYFGNNDKYAYGSNLGHIVVYDPNPDRTITFYVTNCTEVKLLGKNINVTIGSVSSSMRVNECTFSTNGNVNVGNLIGEYSNTTNGNDFTFTSTALDATKIYQIALTSYRSNLYEIAFKTPLEVTADLEAVNGVKSITNFWQAPGYTHNQTFNLSAKNIKNSNVTIEFVPDQDVQLNSFTIPSNSASYTAAQAKAGQEATISFSPTSPTAVVSLSVDTNPEVDNGIIDGKKDGEYTGTINILYGGSVYDQIRVTGKTYHYLREIKEIVPGVAVTTLYYSHPLVVSDDDFKAVEYVSDMSYENNTIEMTDATVVIEEGKDPIIPKRFGVVVEPKKAGSYKFPIYNEYNGEISIGTNYLKGTTKKNFTRTDALKEATGSNAKILTLGRKTGDRSLYGFYNYTENSLAAYKTYLLYDPQDSQSGDSNDAIFFSIGGSGSEYTAIQKVENVREQTEDGVWYTLQGVRLSDKPAQRGLYLHNGKKIMVK